jgi:hypothetical protein
MSANYAVRPAQGNVDASAGDNFDGDRTNQSSGNATYSARTPGYYPPRVR